MEISIDLIWKYEMVFMKDNTYIF